MASKALEFQRKLLTDVATRKAFADDPAQVLKDLGVALPVDIKVPSHIPLGDLEAQIQRVQEALKEQQIDLSDIAVQDPPTVTRLIEETIPIRTSDLKAARSFHEGVLSRARLPGGPGDVALVALVAAVVAAVVALPVKVYGKSAKELERFAGPVAGVEGISRLGGSYVLHGPGGVRVEGLDAAGVANVIKGLR